MDPHSNEWNEHFLRRLKKRRPEIGAEYERQLERAPRAALEGVDMGGAGAGGADDGPSPRAAALETIVSNERPVLFVKDGAFNTTDVTVMGPEAKELVAMMTSDQARAGLLPALPLVGRFDVKNFGGMSYIGSGWFVDTEIVVTNRHVASLVAREEGAGFVFRRGAGGRPIDPAICSAHEVDDMAVDPSRSFAIKDVLYIEPDSGPNDIAFVRVVRTAPGSVKPFIDIASADAVDDAPVCVIGYPARAPDYIIPDQDMMEALYRGKYDVKRAAPGFSMGTRAGSAEHDCTTLGGNSGSVVLDFDGRAVGLHYAGQYRQANYAVPASVLSAYISGRQWNRPIRVEDSGRTSGRTASASGAPVGGSGGGSGSGWGTTAGAAPGGGAPVAVTINITINAAPTGASVSVAGAPVLGSSGSGAGGANTPVDVPAAESAVAAFWKERPDGVIGARVGYLDDGDSIGDTPCIAASVPASMLVQARARFPREFGGVSVRYVAATIEEQVAAMPSLEAASSIKYDDNQRTGAGFSLEPMKQPMDVLLHVGPEYSWEVLGAFLSGAATVAGVTGEGVTGETDASRKGTLVVGMYEFHADHVRKAIEQRLDAGGSLKISLDNTTFAEQRDGDGSFNRDRVFRNWTKRFRDRFEHVKVPEGSSGLISDAYHIKVAVRPDDTFWLSSGNWKATSSQPIITPEQRSGAAALPGNREWHVVIRNKELAGRFRSHLLQDLKRSRALEDERVREAPAFNVWVDVPIEEGVELEAVTKVPRHAPRTLTNNPNRPIKVQPLLTPDNKGAVYCNAVLDLIRSAKKSLYFQIPYINTPSTPGGDRGFIDNLIEALAERMRALKGEARVLLASRGPETAWHFKSKGVNVKDQIRTISRHHTKGMIVDGKRVLIGSHNWSGAGVTLNRDASLLFDDDEVAKYFTDAFTIDWNRSRPVTPSAAKAREAVGGAPPPPGYRPVRLADVSEDDG